MNEVDKPFGCPQPGCSMSFTNEDHLMVHRRRHEMELTVNGEHHTPTLVKHPGFIMDQTPTPTRFLRQCEEVGLFQEINLNPFDEQFRRASLLRSSHSFTEALGGTAGESLDTPRVLPPVDSDETISSTSRDDISGTSTTGTSTHSTSLSVMPSSTSQQNTATSSSYSRPQSSARVLETEVLTEEKEGEPSGRLSLNVSSASEAGQNTNSVISTPTPVITAGPSVTQALGVVGVGVSSGSVKVGSGTQASSQSSTLCTASTGVPPSPSATVLQLLLRLPNGQAIPVEIPTTPMVSSSSTNTTVTTVSGSPPHSGETKVPQPSLAKMKLKQALASSNTAARPGCSKTSRANTADRIAEMTRSRNFSGTSSTEGEGEEDSTNSSNNSSKGERRRRHSSDNEDPVEKRKKFLERNRAAAIRCREKKKKWIENLSMKYDELGSINLKLQTEVSGLRSEVAALKSMLLQHKDCPVTLAMQGDNCVDGMNSCDNLNPLPPMLTPLMDGVRLTSQASHKPRTRSLSLPSIPSSTASPSDPLPVNLSCSSFPTTSVCSPVSSSTKVDLQAVGTPVGMATVSSVNLTNSLITAVSQPAVFYPSTGTARLAQPTILKLSNAAHSPGQILVQTTGAPQLGKVAVVGGADILGTEGLPKNLVVSGTSNVIVTSGPASADQTALGQPHLLNLTLHQTPQTKSPAPLRKSD